ncbi:TPA: hypothetical protein JRX32_002241 [Elizabethkingia anophelis]|uniref:hypothetical protein n=1 Tax=Elizabethkingia anophelis TaxID=1117645 RepID=UPI0016252CAA|nr:hypothetical protein [Elizabethkingia anophelis]MCT4323137.1 hypothetical protein [Elizabethkingia anophelis]HAY3535615.1 hypothetical protein [Elizabethkingia anophelis]HAY3547730.1 hypothetical protein [Elizabethkingia anophelis]HAY3592551.1 hypothetical protein [Elizabethkingia anophelis]
MKEEILYIDNPQKSLDEINNLIEILYQGFMAVAIDYGYHVNNIFGQSKDGKHEIYELRDNINYRIDSANLHFYLLLKRKFEIEKRFENMLKEKPTVFNGFVMGNPYFERASDEVMALYDSIIFHLSSCFDYLAMLIQFIFGKNPESKLQWITLVKHSHNSGSEFANRKFIENIKTVDADFVSKFNDYRAELIHRKKSTSFANVSWEINSGKVFTKFKCSDKIKTNLKKIIDKDLNYCVSYASSELIKQTLLKVAYVMNGIYDEFRENYRQNAPKLNNGGFQLISMNPITKHAESPSLGYWNNFMEYKKFSQY